MISKLTTLNPAADEYTPIYRTYVAQLLPPPRSSPYHPPPHSANQLPPPPPWMSIPLSHHIVWAPVPFAYATSPVGHPRPGFNGKLTAAPAFKTDRRISGKAPPKLARSPPTYFVCRRAVPPRHLDSRSAASKKLRCRKNNCFGSPVPENPPENVHPYGNCTSLMIRNIPNRLCRSELINLLAEHCSEINKTQSQENSSEFDLVYLPMDFKRRGNLGYAFVNFTTVAGAAGLYREWNRLGWNKFESLKVRVISRAKIQGKDRLRAHLAKLSYGCHTDDYLPVELTPACNGGNLSEIVATTIGVRVEN